MRRIASAVLLVVAAGGCIGPTSAVILPECVARIEVQGQHSRDGDRRIVLDHTLDPPLSRTVLQHEHVVDGRKVIDDIDIVSSRPDLAHLVVGAGFGAGAALLGAVAVREVVIEDRSWFDAQPFYALLFGSTLGLAGAVIVGTGWHPPGDTILPDTCPEVQP